MSINFTSPRWAAVVLEEHDCLEKDLSSVALRMPAKRPWPMVASGWKGTEMLIISTTQESVNTTLQLSSVASITHFRELHA